MGTVIKPCRSCGQLIEYSYKDSWWCNKGTQARHCEPEDISNNQPSIMDKIDRLRSEVDKNSSLLQEIKMKTDSLMDLPGAVHSLRKVLHETSQDVKDLRK